MGRQIAKCFNKCTGKGEDEVKGGYESGEKLAYENGGQEPMAERRRREEEDRAYRDLNQYDSYGG